jgi:hypothetical protein
MVALIIAQNKIVVVVVASVSIYMVADCADRYRLINGSFYHNYMLIHVAL